MNLDEARQFLRENHRAILSTFRADGRPQLSPVAVGVDAEGRAVVSSRETAFKVKNLRRDPRASVCVVSDNWYGGWLQADGTASIVSLPEAMDLLIDYYRRLAGEHSDWAEYRASMVADRRVVLTLPFEHVYGARRG